MVNVVPVHLELAKQPNRQAPHYSQSAFLTQNYNPLGLIQNEKFDCPVRAFFPMKLVQSKAGKDDSMAKPSQTSPVVGGVDTHKDLHVAAVVDQNDQVLGTQSFATTWQGCNCC